MNILYITGGYFPTGSAYASRTLHIARALQSKGHDVFVLADYSDEDILAAEGQKSTCGIRYATVDARRQFGGKALVKAYMCALDAYLQAHTPDIAVCASDHDRFPAVYASLRKQGIPILLESCEWFGPYNWSYGVCNPRYYKFLHCWHHVYPKVDGVIAISRLLAEHYKKYTDVVVRVPTVLPSEDYRYSEEPTSDRMVRLIYAGSAGKSKDLLKNLILALYALNSTEITFTLDVYGIDKKGVAYQLGKDAAVLESAADYVRVHGHVLQSEINGCYCNSDLSVLLRPRRRSSQAGFPTKLAESMMAGTPVLCNDTGDVSLYVRSGENGWIVPDYTVETIKTALLSIQAMPAKERAAMRCAARKTAETAFDYLTYAEMLDALLNMILEGK